MEKTLPPSQAGFRKGIEITDQLLRVSTPIKNAMFNCGFMTIIAALDIQKAFDSMWHDGFKLKLTQLNFNINLIRWILSFLYKQRKSKYMKLWSYVRRTDASYTYETTP